MAKKLYWLSFADGTLPEGSQFLGLVLTYADSFVEAVVKSHVLGVNPGGEVLGIDIEADPDLINGFTDRLILKEEAVKLAQYT